MRQRTRLIVNVLSNYGTFGLYGICNFILVGYVVRRLGRDAFGIIALVMSLTAITELLSRGVCLGLTKYIAAEISNRDFDKINRYTNTSLVWFGICGLIGGIFCTVLAIYIDRMFQIPTALVSQGRFAMLLMGCRVFLCFPFNTFQSILWAYQRYDLTNLSKSITIVLRVLLVILYFEFISVGLIELVAITICTLVLERILWVVFSMRIAEKLRLSFSFLSTEVVRVLAKFGGLMLMIHVANMIGYEAVKWVLGIELSVMDTGAYTLIAMLAVFAGAMVRSIANVLVPVASRFDTLKRHDKNTTLTLLGTKYVMIISGFMCLAPLFLLKPFLTLWVGDEYPVQYMSKLALAGMILLLGQWFITVAVCILQMLTGIGKIQFPAKVTVAWAVGGLGGVWLYLHWIDNSLLAAVVGIAAARAIGSVVQLIYGMAVLKLKSKEFLFGAILRPGLVGVTVCALSVVMMNHWDVYKIKEFILTVILLFTVYAVATWTITFSSAERCTILAALRPIANKMRSA